MEPAGERREHEQNATNIQAFTPRPQWSPPVNGGSSGRLVVGLEVLLEAAMEPAVGRREHGPQILGGLTCATRLSRERSGP